MDQPGEAMPRTGTHRAGAERTALRTQDTPGDALLPAPPSICSGFTGSAGHPGPQCRCAPQAAGVWKNLVATGLGGEPKILAFHEDHRSRTSPLFGKGKSELKKVHLSL